MIRFYYLINETIYIFIYMLIRLDFNRLRESVQLQLNYKLSFFCLFYMLIKRLINKFIYIRILTSFYLFFFLFEIKYKTFLSLLIQVYLSLFYVGKINFDYVNQFG